MLKRSDSASTQGNNFRSVSKSRLDQSLDRNVSFTEDKIGGSRSILENSLNLDESVNFQREGQASGYSDARRPTQDEVAFFEGIRSEIERKAAYKFDRFEVALVSSQNAGSIIYKVKIKIGAKYIHASVVRHAPNTFGGKLPEILKVELNKYENDPLNWGRDKRYNYKEKENA